MHNERAGSWFYLVQAIKWATVAAFSLLFLITVLFYTLIFSSTLRHFIFPLQIEHAGIKLVCHDFMVTAPGTVVLKGAGASGKSFRIDIPEAHLGYTLFPPAITGISTDNPSLRITYQKSGKRFVIPHQLLQKALSLVKIRNGAAFFQRHNIKLDIININLNPVSKGSAKWLSMLADGTADFSAVFGKQTIKGSATIFMERQTGLIHIASNNITALLPGHAPLAMEAHIQTGLTSREMGIFRGSVKVRDTLPLLPRSLLNSPYMQSRTGRNRSDEPRRIPASADLVLDLKRKTTLDGRANLPPWLLPRNLGVTRQLPATWHLDIASNFLEGNFTASVPDAFSDISVKFKINQSHTVEWSSDIRTSLENFKLEVGENYATEGLKADIHARFQGKNGPDVPSGTTPIAWELDCKTYSGDVMLYPWFFNLADIKPAFRARGNVVGPEIFFKEAAFYSPIAIKARNLRIDTKNMAIPDLSDPAAALKTFMPSNGDVQVTGDLSATYRLLFKDPFSIQYSALKVFDPRGSFRLRFNHLGIEIRLDADLAWKESQVVKGMQLQALVPFAGDTCNTGTLSWNSILIPLLPPPILPEEPHPKNTPATEDQHNDIPKDSAGIILGSDSLYLDVCRDRFEFGPVSFEAGNGTITIARAVFEYKDMSLHLHDVDIKHVTVEKIANDFPLHTVVDAKGLEVEIKSGIARERGTITTRVAGGEVTKDNMWIDFSGPTIRYGGEIKFKDIDLEILSSLTSFGKITGRISGYIKGLVMAGTQPESFDMALWSTKMPGVRQKISVKAIRNISILGGGNGGLSILGEFFKDFSFKRLGLSCKLENDIFTLHGLIKKNGQEFIVERGIWGGVNVINQNPDSRIAFSDMVERLNRIRETGKAEVK